MAKVYHYSGSQNLSVPGQNILLTNGKGSILGDRIYQTWSKYSADKGQRFTTTYYMESQYLPVTGPNILLANSKVYHYLWSQNLSVPGHNILLAKGKGLLFLGESECIST